MNPDNTPNPRIDFAGFLSDLEAEIRWIGELHSNDRTGQAASDQRALRELADKVRLVGKRLGFL